MTAAELAAKGFTAGADALDGQWGFFQVAGGGFDADRIVSVLGNPWTIVNPGISIKPYPCGCLGHPTMDAMLTLVTEHDVKPDQIRRIRLRAGSNILNPLRYTIASTELEAKFCPAFMLSAVALRRRAGVNEFSDEFVKSAPVQAMMRRVETIFDQEIENQGFVSRTAASSRRSQVPTAAVPSGPSRVGSCATSSMNAGRWCCRRTGLIRSSNGSRSSNSSATCATSRRY